jgi:hypothetical protein
LHQELVLALQIRRHHRLRLHRDCRSTECVKTPKFSTKVDKRLLSWAVSWTLAGRVTATHYLQPCKRIGVARRHCWAARSTSWGSSSWPTTHTNHKGAKKA